LRLGHGVWELFKTISGELLDSSFVFFEVSSIWMIHPQKDDMGVLELDVILEILEGEWEDCEECPVSHHRLAPLEVDEVKDALLEN